MRGQRNLLGGWNEKSLRQNRKLRPFRRRCESRGAARGRRGGHDAGAWPAGLWQVAHRLPLGRGSRGRVSARQRGLDAQIFSGGAVQGPEHRRTRHGATVVRALPARAGGTSVPHHHRRGRVHPVVQCRRAGKGARLLRPGRGDGHPHRHGTDPALHCPAQADQQPHRAGGGVRPLLGGGRGAGLQAAVRLPALARHDGRGAAPVRRTHARSAEHPGHYAARPRP